MDQRPLQFDSDYLASLRLDSLQFDNVKIGFPIVQAALSGYSDHPMRLIARRMGAPYTVCEVMLDKFLVEMKKGRQRTQHFLHLTKEESPVGGQLMGAEPEQFSAGAVKLVEAGFDVIDINFGCPVKKVLGRCRGGFHLSQPDVALEIIQRTRAAVPADIPVTLKVRRGIDESQESLDKFYTILDGAFAEGLAAVTIHCRTVVQRYIGPSRWEFLREVKQHVGDKIILGSGDLFRAIDCFEMMRQTGVDGVTVARGAIGNPWIFPQALALAAGKPLPPPPTVHEQADVIREHFRLAHEVYQHRCGVMMRKFGIKYSALHPRPIEVRDAFVKCKTIDEWMEVLDREYAEDAPGNYPDPEIHRVHHQCGPKPLAREKNQEQPPAVSPQA